MTATPNYTISKRVNYVWKKLCAWYGADIMEKQFGAVPPRDWCEAIDGIRARDDLERILTQTRQKHVNWPPRLPQFEAIVSDVGRPQQHGRTPNIAEQLTAFVCRTKRLTRAQMRDWTFFGGEGEAHAGVVIPADPAANAPGYRVTVADMTFGESR
jgi:hypothetical protein